MSEEMRAEVGESQSKVLEKFVRDSRKKYGEVIFLVGKEEERIEESLIILQAFSPVFQDLFRDNKSTFLVSMVIKHPEFRPKMFRIFLQVMSIFELST